ncbi:unnamed protein product [Nezara viridula]|uniref:Uncharacterized protein n=1 Tax=Nezara viridula TaxID=85310 RepID=A0A9P0H5E5_NEZVI|nr:unnamed protein product [Nezara viridula]
MKRKHFTKSDRRWCYTLLKLIKKATNRNTTKRAAESQCPKYGKNKKSNDRCVADEVPQLFNLFLKSKNAGNQEELGRLLENSKKLHSLENRKCKNAGNPAKKKVSFADDTNESGDTYTQKHCDSHYSFFRHFESKKDMAKNILEKHSIREHVNYNFSGKGMGSLSDYSSMQGLITRLMKLKNNSPTTDSNEDIREPVEVIDDNLVKSLGPNSSRKNINVQYELTKNSVRKIPFGFLTEIKDVVPGGIDEIIEKHNQRKNSSPGTTFLKELEVTTNSPTTISFMNRDETVDEVNSNTETTEPQTAEEKNSSAVNKKIIRNHRDISSSVGEHYKRVSLALQRTNSTTSKSEYLKERRDELNKDDPFDGLQGVLQGNIRAITTDVDGKLTKVLNNHYYIESMKLSEKNKMNERDVSKHSRSNEKPIRGNFQLVRNFTKMKEKWRTEEKNEKEHAGCECYLNNLLTDREPI